ncbi:MAG: MFS transporter [Streptosporangiales bacterium]|nr:MFS transporter [Streptosporangiales bacterium]
MRVRSICTRPNSVGREVVWRLVRAAWPAQLKLRWLVAFLLVALAMRPAISGVPAVLVLIDRDGVLTATTAGVLVALPVLCFALAAPAGAVLARTLSLRWALLLCLVAMSVGAGMRVGISSVWLWVGTLVLAVAVAFGNVLMPAVIRATFPTHIGVMTAAYAAAIGLGASLSAGLTVPITHLLGGSWRLGIGVWALLSACAAAVWAGSRTRAPTDPTDVPRLRGTRLLGSALAWQVTLVMAMQSLQYQSLASWLPTIYVDHGLGVVHAGFQLSLYTLLGVPASLLMAGVVSWCGRSYVVVLGVGALNLCGLLGLLLVPMLYPTLWSCILGLSQGAAVSLALLFNTMRARSVDSVAQLSAMAQSVGYGIAFVGPLVLGWMRSASGSWTAPIVFLLVSLVGLVWSGIMASRERYVDGGEGPLVLPGGATSSAPLH